MVIGYLVRPLARIQCVEREARVSCVLAPRSVVAWIGGALGLVSSSSVTRASRVTMDSNYPNSDLAGKLGG
jgi:hypothetical protein